MHEGLAIAWLPLLHDALVLLNVLPRAHVIDVLPFGDTTYPVESVIVGPISAHR